MALTIVSPLVLPGLVLPGAEIADTDVYAAYAAIQSCYEQVIPPLVIDPDTGTTAIVLGDTRNYRIPCPRREAATTLIDVWFYARAPVSTEITLGYGSSSALSFSTVGWHGWTDVPVTDDADYTDIFLWVTDLAGTQYLPFVLVMPSRARTTMPTGELDNYAVAIDLAEVADEKPLSVHRHCDAVSQAEAIFGWQYRSAIQAAAWQPTQTILDGPGEMEGVVEVPDSLTQRTATLTIWFRSDDTVGGETLSCSVDGVSKTVTMAAAGGWASETWTVATRPDGCSRPGYVVVRVVIGEPYPDFSLSSASGYWSEVAP